MSQPSAPAAATVKLTVNGEPREFIGDPQTPLLWVLRDAFKLTGTKYSCGIGMCGACTVHLDGQAVRACSLPVSAVEPNQRIVTIEGLSPDRSHPVQRAWAELDVPQCGFCQSGMIMAAAALLTQTPKPSEAEIRREITNICRCGTYNRVLAGISLAAERGEAGRG